MLLGIALASGRRENDSLLVRVLGVAVIAGAGTVLFVTVRRWAGYFFAACLIATAKAVLALIFGVTVSTPHLVTDRPVVSVLLGLLAALSFLTFRFVTALTLDAVSLVLGVIGLAGAMMTEPNYWPLYVSVGVLAIAWLAEAFLKKPQPARIGSNEDQ